jgi:hypothetical protein
MQRVLVFYSSTAAFVRRNHIAQSMPRDLLLGRNNYVNSCHHLPEVLPETGGHDAIYLLPLRIYLQVKEGTAGGSWLGAMLLFLFRTFPYLPSSSACTTTRLPTSLFLGLMRL